MIKLIVAALFCLAGSAKAQTLTTINENLWTTGNWQYFDTATTGYSVLGGSMTVLGNFGAATINSTTTFTAPITFSSNVVVSRANFTVTDSTSATGANVLDMAQWTTWAPTITGFSGSPTCGTCRYKRIGTTLCIQVQQLSGTSNATGLTFTIPFVADVSVNEIFGAGCTNSSAGSTGSCFAETSANSNVVTAYSGNYYTGWANTGTKTLNVNGCFEVAQ